MAVTQLTLWLTLIQFEAPLMGDVIYGNARSKTVGDRKHIIIINFCPDARTNSDLPK